MAPPQPATSCHRLPVPPRRERHTMKRTATPHARLRAARDYCEAHGWDLVAVYRDEGKSARTDDLARRPDFARMLADAEAGLFDVVISHKLDRFARNRRVAFDAFHR